MVDVRFYDLLKYLGRGGSWQYLWTPDTDEGKLSFWFPAGKPKEVNPLWKSINVYFSVHPSRIEKAIRERTKIEDVEAVNCLFAEFDLAPGQSPEYLLEAILQIEIPPSVIVFSGGGYHCYWLLEQTYHIDSDDARQRIIDIQYAWVDFTGSDGGAKDLARVLRVPGTFNRKPEYAPNYPEIKIIKFDLEDLYSLDDFVLLVEGIIEKTKARRVEVANTDAVPVDLDDQTILEKMFEKDGAAVALWDGDMSAQKDDHSDADLALCNKLAFWFGRDRERIDRVFRRSGLFRPKWLRDDYRNKTIDKAISGTANTYTPAGSNWGNVQGLVEPAMVNTNGTHGTTAGPAPQSNSATIDDLLARFSADDNGNAQAVYLLYGQEFIYCGTHGYLRYNGRYWETAGAEAGLTRAIVETLVRRRTIAVQRGLDPIVRITKADARIVSSCLYLFKSLIEKDINIFDADPVMLNCQNGVVNLQTGALTPHSPSQHFTYCVPVDYDLHADYKPWTDFLYDTVGAPELVNYIKLAAGYTATGHTSEECLFYIHGPTRSGKGTFSETLLTILCKPLGVQADFSTFTVKREGDTQNFDLAPLKPARLIIASESNKYDSLNEAKVKTVTGGDWIRCAFKHRTHFEFRPQFKIWLLSNHPIKGDVDDDAFWGRVKIIHFPNSRLGREDKTLKRRMKSNTVLRGVLRWIVEGAMEWFKNPQGLQSPPVVDDANKQRRYELDYIQQWIDACCKINPTAWTQNNAVYYSYKEWCEGVGIKPKSMESLGQILTKKNFKTGIQRRIGNGQRQRGIEGLSIA